MRCICCHTDKPSDQFYPARKDGRLRRLCKACAKERQRSYDRDRARRTESLFVRLGLVNDKYAELVEALGCQGSRHGDAVARAQLLAKHS